MVKRVKDQPRRPFSPTLREPSCYLSPGPLTPYQAEWAPLPFAHGTLPTGALASCSSLSPWATAGHLC